MRGERTKLGEGERKVRLCQDRMTVLSYHHSGLLRTFGICIYVWDFYDFRECYVRDCYVCENYVAPFTTLHFLCSLEWAQKARELHYIEPERLARDKHSTFWGPLVSYEENEVL